MPLLAPLVVALALAPAEAAPAEADPAPGDGASEAATAAEPPPAGPAADVASPAAEPPPAGPAADAAAGVTGPAAPAAPPLDRRRTVLVRPHRGLTIAGAVLTGLGLAGRLGIDVFLGTAGGLRADEAYGTWSVGPFFMATSFSNAPTLVGLGLLAGGAFREGHRDGGLHGKLADRRRQRLGVGLLGGGLGLWALSRALFYPWVEVCQTNGCAYGYLETTYYASAGLTIAGLRMVAYQAGLGRAKRERDADYIHITPVLSPTLHGLALSGRF